MKMKSFLFLTMALNMFFMPSGVTQAAVTPVQYTNPVRVELSTNSVTVSTNGIYQIKNLSSNETLLLRAGLPISLSKGTSLTAKFGGYTLNSAAGFELNEVSGPAEYVTFYGTIGAKRNASLTEPDLVTYKNGEAAEYVSTYTDSNKQTWFIIKAKNGSQLAVFNNPNVVKRVSAPSINLLAVNGTNTFRGSYRYVLNSSGTAAQLINILSMQFYLKGVLPNEMPAEWHLEALKAQAVAARSYAYVKNQRSVLSRTTSSQVYNGFSSEHSNTNAAVDATNEKYVKFNNRVIETFFHSTSGGRTANVGDVWNSNQTYFPYLVTREDTYEASPYSTWVRNIKASTILSSFKLDASTPLYSIGTLTNKVYGTGPTANGEVSGITLKTALGDKSLTGNELFIRKLFPVDGSYGFLPSNWFTIKAEKDYKIQLANTAVEQFNINGSKVQLANSTTTLTQAPVQINTGQIITKETDPASIEIHGRGFGHRLGMSQYGAQGFAKNGWTYDKILSHYFANTTISGL